MVCEQIMERIARHVGRPVHEVKALNMYEVRPLLPAAETAQLLSQRLAGLQEQPCFAKQWPLHCPEA